MQLIKGKCCDKCGSKNVYLDFDMDCWYEHCLICGYTVPLEKVEPVNDGETSWPNSVSMEMRGNNSLKVLNEKVHNEGGEKESTKTLYECPYTKVCGTRVYCDKGYKLSQESCDGSVSMNLVENDIPLIPVVCLACPYFDGFASLLPDKKKKWFK